MARLCTFKAFAILGLTALFGFSNAQFSSSNISLYKQFTLANLGASSGNSCWGYVSPSGREYAIMDLDNKVAFIEITDPTNAVYFASIPHTSNLWGDVKTYGTTLYACTELAGSGLQVIDLKNIDNHVVTLVKTLSSPGRSHTIHVDNASGFLYCCGTHQGTGTTMCFDLKTDPLNPVQVGSASLTTTYQHETLVLPYTTGQYAGKQIMFSGGEGRGLEIWDVTNKSAVTLIRRIAYPFVGYCHQSWISPDRKYLYVNDELDEENGFVPQTRTLVFDVSVLATADLVATFSTGKTSIDHNLYNRNGFIFEGNYTSGMNVFDANANPLAPVYRGFFDTYPEDDGAHFDGVWGNYPFFPSGTVVCCDLNRGVFILDVSEATKTDFAVNAVTNVRGKVLNGGVPELATQDQQYYTVANGLVPNAAQPPIEQVFEGSSLWTDISKIKFNLRISANTPGLQQTVELWDWTTSSWTAASTTSVPTTDTSFVITAPNPDRFVDQATKKLKARLTVKAVGVTNNATWNCSLDVANWTVNP